MEKNIYNPSPNPNFPEPKKSTGIYAMWVSIANIAGYVGACAFAVMTTHFNPFAFFALGLVFSALNLGGMVTFIVLKKTGGWVACLIYMLIFPLIGFGMCTANAFNSGPAHF